MILIAAAKAALGPKARRLLEELIWKSNVKHKGRWSTICLEFTKKKRHGSTHGAENIKHANSILFWGIRKNTSVRGLGQLAVMLQITSRPKPMAPRLTKAARAVSAGRRAVRALAQVIRRRRQDLTMMPLGRTAIVALGHPRAATAASQTIGVSQVRRRQA